MKFADVTNDIAFRKIFGNETKKISLISFLNAVIKFPNNNKVIEVDILNPYQLPNLSAGKSTIVDVKAKDALGNTFIVEMQIAESSYFHKRILYYTSQSYTSQIGEGKKYDKLNPVYFIGILEFEIGNNPNYISCHKVMDIETKENIIQDVEFNFIELPKFTKNISELESPIDQWTYFIKNAENLNVIPENIQDEGLKQAYLGAAKHNWTQPELDDYERASIKERDIIGREELMLNRAMRKTAMTAKKIGLSTEDIIKLTGLSQSEIENIKVD